MKFQKNKMDNPKSYVKNMNFSSNIETIEMGEFFIKKVVVDSDKGYAVYLYIASSKNYYSISASSGSKDNITLVRFLNSFRLASKTILKKDGIALDVPSTTEFIEKLQSSPIVKDALEKKCDSKIQYEYDTKKPENKPVITSDTSAASATEYSRHLIILRKPKAPLSAMPSHRIVRLRVSFQPNGCIGPIIVIVGGKDNETMAAIKAAAQMKFLPAEKAGKPVNIVKTVEYVF